jgi:cyanophycin synthetase
MSPYRLPDRCFSGVPKRDRLADLVNLSEEIMRIVQLWPLAGPNIWSPTPVLEIRLDRPDGEAEQSAYDCCERVRNWLADIPVDQRESDGGESRFARQVAGARHPWTVFAAFVQKLQTIAGTPVDRFWIADGQSEATATAAVEFVEERVARLAVDLARRVLWAEPGEETPSFDQALGELRRCAEQACFGATTGPIVAAARARAIPVMRLDGDCLVQLGYGSRQRRLMGSITGRTGFLAEAISRDKVLTKRLLAQLGIPVPEGRLAADAADAWAAACELGLPVVVKPRDEDCGVGVSLMLRTKAQVTEAYVRARVCRPDVLVERQLAGVPHRLFIVDGRIVAAVRRDPAQVTGDGEHTVGELVVAENRDPRRGETREFPWYPIVVDDEARQVLADQGLTSDSIPDEGRLVALRYDPKSCYGGTLQEITERVHPETAAAAVDAVRATGLDVAGVDVMALDISRPLAGQQGGLLEVNAGPAIYLHRSPICAPARPVAEAIVDSLIPTGASGRIPIIAVAGGKDSASLARTIAARLQRGRKTVGLATQEGIQVGGAILTRKPADDFDGCRALLLHPRVDIAVCELSRENLRQEGLPFDQCQIAVIGEAWTNAGQAATPGDGAKCLQLLIDSVPADGAVIANVDDPALAALLEPGDLRLIAGAIGECSFLEQHRGAEGVSGTIDGGDVVIAASNSTIVNRCLEITRDVAGRLPSMVRILAGAASWSLNREIANACRPRRARRAAREACVSGSQLR